MGTGSVVADVIGGGTGAGGSAVRSGARGVLDDGSLARGAGGASCPQPSRASETTAATGLRTMPGAYRKPGEPSRQRGADSSKVHAAMAHTPSTLTAALALLALGLSACNRAISCSSEVTQGSGTYRGAASGTRSEQDLRHESVRIACGQLCAAGGPAKAEGCVGRCTVDAEAGKIGARTTCQEGSSR